MSTFPRHHLTDAAKALVASLRSEGDPFNRSMPMYLQGDDVVYHTRIVGERPGASPFTSTEIYVSLVNRDGSIVAGSEWDEEAIEEAYQALRHPRIK